MLTLELISTIWPWNDVETHVGYSRGFEDVFFVFEFRDSQIRRCWTVLWVSW